MRLTEEELKETLKLYRKYKSYRVVAEKMFITPKAVKYRINKIKNMQARKKGNKETLCWTCKKSIGKNMCSWAKSFTPVEGWKAKEIILGLGTKTCKHINSYCVEECPLYECDEVTTK